MRRVNKPSLVSVLAAVGVRDDVQRAAQQSAVHLPLCNAAEELNAPVL